MIPRTPDHRSLNCTHLVFAPVRSASRFEAAAVCLQNSIQSRSRSSFGIACQRTPRTAPSSPDSMLRHGGSPGRVLAIRVAASTLPRRRSSAGVVMPASRRRRAASAPMFGNDSSVSSAFPFPTPVTSSERIPHSLSASRHETLRARCARAGGLLLLDPPHARRAGSRTPAVAGLAFPSRARLSPGSATRGAAPPRAGG